ncbi:MAG: polymer-forming cytoskeletal protein [Candidatus Aminicenantaceae bacterium]
MKLSPSALGKTEKAETTSIMEGISIIGDIKGSHNLTLNGDLEGKIDLSALLTVGKTGRFKGEVKAEYVIIEGDMEGKVVANEKVELRGGAKYRGEILAPSVMISDTAFFDGNVKMMREGVESQVLDITEKTPPAEEKSAE